jgi:hypothetical protein
MHEIIAHGVRRRKEITIKRLLQSRLKAKTLSEPLSLPLSNRPFSDRGVDKGCD